MIFLKSLVLFEDSLEGIQFTLSQSFKVGKAGMAALFYRYIISFTSEEIVSEIR